VTAFLSLRGATQSQDAEDETASQTKRRARGDKWRVTARISLLCHCEERSDEAKVGGRISRRCEERSDEATS